MTPDDAERRIGRLEAWVETVMGTLAGLGLEDLLCDLDVAREANEPE
jgi:hypothetical protein